MPTTVPNLAIDSTDPNDPYAQIRRSLAIQPPPSLAIAPISPGPSGGGSLAIAPPMPEKAPDVSAFTNPQPAVKAPRGTVEGDQARRTELLSHPAALENVYHDISHSGFGQTHPLLGKILGGLAQVPASALDIGLTAAAPRVAGLIPGTMMNRGEKIQGENQELTQLENEREKEAQTRETESLPALHQAQAELAGAKLNEKTAHDQDVVEQHLRSSGFKHDEGGNIVPLPYGEMSEQQQAVYDLKGSQEELAEASKQLKEAQSDPNSIQFKLAEARVLGAQQARQIALQRLGLSEATFEARYHGTDTGGNPLPGAMITDEGKPVGSSFSQNVRPTGQERNKADMATSAREQLTDIKSIVQKHPTLFGPGYGQTSAFRQWIGSQDPDAQRFLAARTIAADHLAGTFGGRSEAALDALDKAIGQFKDNPKAMEAGLDQLMKANKVFESKGSVKTAGSNAAKGPQEGDMKTNSAGDKVVFKGGSWQIQSK